MILELHRAVSNITKRTAFEDVRPSAKDKSKMEVELATLIFRGVPLVTIASIVNAMIAVIVGWSMVKHSVLLGWCAAVILVALLRMGYWFTIRGKRPTLSVMSRFKKNNMLTMMMNGMLWGALAPIFAVYGQIGHIFLPFILAGMTAACVVSAGACWRCVMAFNIPALLPLAMTYFAWGGEGSIWIGGVIGMYTVVTLLLAVHTNNMIKRAIALRSRNSHLKEALVSKADERNEAMKRFQAIIESSRELTLIFSPEGRITYASPAVEHILDYTPSQILGMTSRDLLHEDDFEQFRAAGEKALSVLGEVREIPHICMKSQKGEFVPMAGRITNFLYVPGIEGFVYAGSPQEREMAARLHAAE